MSKKITVDKLIAWNDRKARMCEMREDEQGFIMNSVSAQFLENYKNMIEKEKRK